MSDARASVLVVCRNEGAQLGTMVDRLLGTTTPPLDLIVVDDWCQDVATSHELARLTQTEHQVHRAPTRGRAVALNAAIETTHTSLLAIVDASQAPHDSFIEQALTDLETVEDHGFVLSSVTGDETGDRSAHGIELDAVAMLTTLDIHRPAVLRRTVWEKTGGFDTTLSEVAEIDFWITALVRGLRGYSLAGSAPTGLFNSRRSVSEAISRERWKQLRRRLYEKHANTVTSRLDDLLTAKEALLLEQRRHQEDLVGRSVHLGQQLADLDQDVGTALKELGR